MITCPYCGSGRIKTVGGMNGNPFDQTTEKTVCLDCGRPLLGSGMEIPIPEISPNSAIEQIIVIEGTACAKGVTKSAKMTVPYKDGEYNIYSSAWEDYPFSRFGSVTVKGDTITFDGETLTLALERPAKTMRVFAAYDAARYPWREEVNLTFTVDFRIAASDEGRAKNERISILDDMR